VLHLPLKNYYISAYNKVAPWPPFSSASSMSLSIQMSIDSWENGKKGLFCFVYETFVDSTSLKNGQKSGKNL